MLKPVVNAISGFSLKHLKTDAQCAGEHYQFVNELPSSG
jgi:hypothetical protein